MNNDRYVICDFCDDVRQEIGNKISLMGLYSSDMIFESFPVVLPKFCIRVKAVTLIDRPFEKLIFRALLNDELLFEMDSSAEQLQEFKSVPHKDGATKSMAIAIMVLSSFVISSAGRLRVVVETEEGEIKGGFIDLSARVPA